MSAPYPPPNMPSAAVEGAKLFANRVDALKFWAKGARVAEIGVAFGDYSKHIIDKTGPAKFDAYDIFKFHELDILWGKAPSETLGDKTHRDFYDHRFADLISSGTVSVFEGDGATELVKQGAGSYDIIYIDALHDYAGVKRDLQASLQVIKDDGMLVFNDYSLYNRTKEPWGVVPVVNELCQLGEWKVDYLALQNHMFCDIALSRR